MSLGNRRPRAREAEDWLLVSHIRQLPDSFESGAMPEILDKTNDNIAFGLWPLAAGLWDLAAASSAATFKSLISTSNIATSARPEIRSVGGIYLYVMSFPNDNEGPYSADLSTR
ncbi:MAG: hypothetical protein AAF585_18675 [Verrucomicrobiota bacterium]